MKNKPKIYDETDEFSFFDSQPFKDYVLLIESALSGAPMTIADIHRALGESARREFTLDALAWSDKVEEVGVCPSRYVLKKEAAVKIEKPFRDRLSELFAKTGRPASEKPLQSSVYGKDSEFGYR